MITEGGSWGTYSNNLVLGRSREKLAVWAKAYAPNVQIVRTVRNFIDQNAGQQTASGPPSARDTEGTEPNFGASLRIIDLGCLNTARRQIIAIDGKPNTSNNTRHRKRDVKSAIPVIAVAEGDQMRLPTFRGIVYEPS